MQLQTDLINEIRVLSLSSRQLLEPQSCWENGGKIEGDAHDEQDDRGKSQLSGL